MWNFSALQILGVIIFLVWSQLKPVESFYKQCCEIGTKRSNQLNHLSRETCTPNQLNITGINVAKPSLCHIYAVSCCLKQVKKNVCLFGAKLSQSRSCDASFQNLKSLQQIAIECCLCCRADNELSMDMLDNCKMLNNNCPTITTTTTTITITTVNSVINTKSATSPQIFTEFKSNYSTIYLEDADDNSTKPTNNSTESPYSNEYIMANVTDNSSNKSNNINSDSFSSTVSSTSLSKTTTKTTLITQPNPPKHNIACDIGKKWDPLLDVCVEMIISCPTGLILHPNTKKCVSIKKPTIKCSKGLKYNQFRKICEDENECQLKNRCTGYQEKCVNTYGSFKCVCQLGFERMLNGKCIDIDECLNSSKCPDNKRCHNTIGSYRCGRIIPCGFGWREDIDTGLCVDVDECAIYADICGRGMKCINIRGSHKCEDKECPGKMKRNNRGICSLCRDGYRYDNRTETCVDIDECNSSFGWTKGKCHVNEICVNLPGSYECYPKKKCLQGTKISFNGTICEDVDECQEMSFRCEEDQICMNTYASYECLETPCAPSEKYNYNTKRCECKEGYKVTKTGYCQDINECDEMDNICGSLYECVNRPGTYTCLHKTNCQSGTYRPAQDAACQDIDECETGEAKCPRNSYCVNIVGSYNCMCRRGYIRLENGICADINECLLFRPEESCPDLEARCVNTPGSYLCRCPKGFIWIDYPVRKCVDVDECNSKSSKGIILKRNPCGQGHTCINTIGSYRCQCSKGYRLTMTGLSCEDIDECLFEPKKCINGRCINKPGGYFCSCPEGFSADSNQICQDIDECSLYSGICSNSDQSMRCLNLHGYYKCVKHSCPDGYSYRIAGNGYNCILNQLEHCSNSDVTCLLRKPFRLHYIFLQVRNKTEIPHVLTRISTQYMPMGESQITLLIKQASHSKTKLPISVRNAFRLRKDRFNAKKFELILWQKIPTPAEVTLNLQLSIYYQGTYYGHADTEIYLYITNN